MIRDVRRCEHDRNDHDGGDTDMNSRPLGARHQLVQELLRGRRTVFAVERKAPLQRAPLVALQAARTRRDHFLIARLYGGHSLERMFARQELVGHARHRVDVVARVGLQAFDHLAARVRRRECAQRAGIEQCRRACQVVCALRGARDAEVENLDDALLRNERIRRLEVRMHDALFVRISHRAAQTAGQPQRPLDGEPFFVVSDDLVERLAFEQLHHHEDVRTVSVEVVDGDDVRVREMLRLARFALQCF